MVVSVVLVTATLVRRPDRHQLLRIIRVDHDRRRTLVRCWCRGIVRPALVAPPRGCAARLRKIDGERRIRIVHDRRQRGQKYPRFERLQGQRSPPCLPQRRGARTHPNLTAAFSEPDLGRDRAHYRFSAIIASPEGWQDSLITWAILEERDARIP